MILKIKLNWIAAETREAKNEHCELKAKPQGI